MNQKLKEFLDAKKDAEKKKYEEEKQKALIELGLYEKVYSESSQYSEEFPNYEWDAETTQNNWYKKEAICISDEEYEEVKKYSDQTNGGILSIGDTDNKIAVILRIIAVIIYIVGFIAGIALGTVEVEKGYYYTYTDTEFSFAIAFSYWCVAIISGTLFFGFAEIIRLLENIKNK